MTLVAGVVVAIAPASNAASSSSWPMFGQNLNNTASASTTISSNNINGLKLKWSFTTGGDVSARAAVANGVAYVPDWSGHLYAIKSGSGKLVWSKNILSDYLPGVFSPAPSKVVSRTSPFLDLSTNTLYVGTQKGGFLLAINATDGSLKWRTQLDPHPLAIVTASPVVYNGNVYVGLSSLEEAAATDPSYPCCSFRGSVMSVNAATGAVNWKLYTVPPGYNGGAVWGSTVVPDPARGYVYATTGNNYFTPTDPAYANCIDNGGTQESCNSPADHFDSVLALSMSTGQVVWSQRLGSSDDWTVACFVPPFTNCPTGSGPDFDFGSGVQLFTIQTAGGPKAVVGAGQKSGIYSVFDAGTGTLQWGTQVGPGSSLGGMEWGSATDGKRIYVQIGNFYGIPYPVNGTLDYAGSWAALDPTDGHIIWQVADPNGAVDLGPMAVANGVVYAPSMAGGATDKNMFALNAATGAIKWSFAAGGSVIAGAVIASDTVFWGSGYSNLGIPGYTANNKFYAFSLGGQ